MNENKNSANNLKVSFSRAFQNFSKGDFVAIVPNKTFQYSFPKRIRGLSGRIEGKRGKTFIVKVKEMNKEKTHLINPIHLKKLKGKQ